MSNEDMTTKRGTNPDEQPWQGGWPGTGPAPSEGERANIEREMAEGKWSESRQRADFTGANQEQRTRDDQARERGNSEGRSDVSQQVGQGSDEPV